MKKKPKIIKVPKGDIAVPGTAYVDGRDPDAAPPLTVMVVNLWNSISREFIVGTLLHGDEVKITKAQRHKKQKRHFFRVRKGMLDGWVSEPFLCPERREPIGDRVWPGQASQEWVRRKMEELFRLSQRE